MASRAGVTGIVLAGGKSRRLGRDKAVEPVGGEPLVRRVIGRLSQVTDETVVVVADAERGGELPLDGSTRVAVDLYPGGGSLGGIFTGLSAASGDWGVVVACDMPFLSIGLLGRLLSAREGYDAVVPVVDGRPEPTHAAYSVRCLPYIEPRLQANDLKIAGFFDEVRVDFLSESEFEREDPQRLSFFNVNTQDDLDRALSLVEAGM
jgi:molybdopterin-guanine dinucleotide biosynthesis protein A